MSDQPTSSNRRLTPAQVIVLVVLAGILALLFYPALSAAREKKAIAACQHNLRGLALSVAMYSDLCTNTPNAGIGKAAYYHLNLLTNVTMPGLMTVCPSDRSRKRSDAPRNALRGNTNLSYGYVAGLLWQDQPDSILMFDRSPSGTTKGSPWTKDSPHGTKGGNQLFLDGHVEFKPTLIQTLKGDAVYTNP
jgi:prepilin-type processing-associated H-X9-DG protein